MVSFMTAVAPWYWIYLLLRMIQGFVATGNIFANVILCKYDKIYRSVDPPYLDSNSVVVELRCDKIINYRASKEIKKSFDF